MGDFVAIPYAADEDNAAGPMEIGYITRKNSILSPAGTRYIEELNKYLEAHGAAR
jgi:hypothetical protein